MRLRMSGSSSTMRTSVATPLTPVSDAREPQQEPGGGRHRGRGRNGEDPRPHDTSGHAPAHGREALRGAYAHDGAADRVRRRSEEHTSELQSLAYLVCRLLLEK